MQEPRPLALFIVATFTACAEPSWPPPVSPSDGGATAPETASGEPPGPGTGGAATAAPTGADIGLPKVPATPLAADKVRLMLPSRLELSASGDDAVGTEKKCMIRFEFDSTGKSTLAKPVGCDAKYAPEIASHAAHWSVEAADGVTLPERSEVFWEIRYTLK